MLSVSSSGGLELSSSIHGRSPTASRESIPQSHRALTAPFDREVVLKLINGALMFSACGRETSTINS